MALKAVHVSDVPNLDQVPENVTLNYLHSPRLCRGQFLLLINHELFYSSSLVFLQINILIYVFGFEWDLH